MVRAEQVITVTDVPTRASVSSCPFILVTVGNPVRYWVKPFGNAEEQLMKDACWKELFPSHRSVRCRAEYENLCFQGIRIQEQ